MKSKQLQFADLVERVQRCSLCPRMTQRTRVLGPPNGNLDSSVVFIAEAPGRLGADKFGIPLYGDQTGRNFETLLTYTGLKRESIFITNAVLCNPRTPRGNNDSPTLAEIRNCSRYLAEVLEIIKPKYIIPLGRVALASLNAIEPHGISLAQGVAKEFPWHGYLVYPLFHPSPRALARRTKYEQLKCYSTIAAFLSE